MKQFLLLISFTFFFYSCVLAQKNTDLFSIRLGASSTNITIKEAFEPIATFVGISFRPGKTFAGDGPVIGVTKNLKKNLFLEFSFSSFKEKHDTKLQVNNNENFYSLKGFQFPVTINYYLRDSTKKIRFYIGSGLQYLKGELKQYESITANGMQTTYQITNINLSEFQFSLKPGIDFRIIPGFFIYFQVQASLSIKGKYSDNPSFGIKYTFLKTTKKQ
jgi:hypothetical protein